MKHFSEGILLRMLKFIAVETILYGKCYIAKTWKTRNKN